MSVLLFCCVCWLWPFRGNISLICFIDNDPRIGSLQVNDRSLEGLNHSESIRTLVGDGSRVKIKLIRFLPGSPQAECITMLQRQVILSPFIN